MTDIDVKPEMIEKADACPHDGEIDVETYGCNAWRVCGEILDSAAWWEAGL